MPPASVENHLVHEYIQKSLSPASWVGHKSSWMIQLQFLNANNLDMFTRSENKVLLFLKFMMKNNYSWSHIHKTFSGISFFQKYT